MRLAPAPARRPCSSGSRRPPSTYSSSPMRTGAVDPRDAARRLHRLGHRRRRGARRAEHDPPPARAVDADDPQPPVPAQPVARRCARRGRRASAAGSSHARERCRTHQRARCARRATSRPGRGSCRRRSRGRAEPAGACAQRPRAVAVGARVGAPASSAAPRRPRRRAPRVPARSSGSRGSTPASRSAATIDPAEVPTMCSQAAKSMPALRGDPAEHAAHPGGADRSARPEHEHVGSLHPHDGSPQAASARYGCT